MISQRVVLELQLDSAPDVRRAMRRGAYRAAARALREQLGYPGAALALEGLAESLRDPHPVEDDGEPTVVDRMPMLDGRRSAG